MVDHDPNDETVLRQPAAPISPQEIVAYLREAASAPPGQQSPWDYLVWWFAADAIEALTAERDEAVRRVGVTVRMARATDAENGRQLALIDELRAENARLTSERDELRIGLWEIAHGDPPANPQDAELAQSLLGEWSGDEYEDVTSRTLRNLSNPEFMSAAFGEKSGAKDDGIDMALLGKLCRKEPDADTKREVAEMMDGIPESPLSHPRYPDLVKMARESSKDGD